MSANSNGVHSSVALGHTERAEEYGREKKRERISKKQKEIMNEENLTNKPYKEGGRRK